MRNLAHLPCLVWSLVHVGSCAYAAAQCTVQWQPGDGVPGVNGQAVSASTMWDPDGPGPLAPRLVIAGTFTTAGNVPAKNIAAWDTATGDWSALGSGIDGFPACLAILPTGELVAGGTFASAGGAAADNIARWDGTTWAPLGSGINGTVRALAVLPNGTLVAGGTFTSAGGGAFTNLAAWNGAAWSGPAASIDGDVTALALLANGDLVVGGGFSTVHGVATSRIARWDGANWWPLGTGVDNWVTALHTRPGGELVVAGQFTSAGGSAAAGIARWNGGTWSAMGAGVQFVRALTTLPNGDVAAGVNQAGYVRVWDGAAWSSLGGVFDGFLDGAVATLVVLPTGELVAGGTFALAGAAPLPVVPASRLARFGGTSWSALTAGTNAPVNGITELPTGDVVVVGSFRSIGGVLANRVALWNGSSWSPLATGMTGMNDELRAVTTMPDGSIVAGGKFALAGGVAANNIARWDGSTWSPLGSGTNTLGVVGAGVRCLTVRPNGELIAGGYFTTAGGVPCNHVASWNGTSWSAMGAGVNAQIFALATLPNGDVVAAGYFSTAGTVAANRVARWDGTAWSALGTTQFGPPGSSTPLSLAVLRNGDLVAAGWFPWLGGVFANNIARWDGTTWSPLGPGVYGDVNALTVLPDGDLVAAGRFTLAGIENANRVARWDGAVWSTLDTGTDGEVFAVKAHSDGSVLAGGQFTTADDQVSAYFARLTSTCPASVVSFGSGCTGSGGTNILGGTTLPWTGSTFRAVATGMPANGLSIAVYGFGSGSTPLFALLPQGVVGCSLSVSPDLLVLGFPLAGAVATALTIPDHVALAGQVLHHQVVPFEFDLSGSLVAITSTNALTLTIGTF